MFDGKTLKIFGRLAVTSAVIIVAMMLFASSARCQATYVGGGVGINRSSNPDPSPEATRDGGITFPSVYAEGGLKLPLGFQARLLAEAGKEPHLRTLFTTDEGTDRQAVYEVRLRPELRFYLLKEGTIRPFVGGAVDYYRQSFKSLRKEEHGGYGRYRSLPTAGLNPLLIVGTGIGYNHEIFYSRIFTDKTVLNPSYLSGHRAGYTYLRPLTERISLKLAGEADYVTFRETNGRGYVDLYYENDFVAKARIGFIFK